MKFTGPKLITQKKKKLELIEFQTKLEGIIYNLTQKKRKRKRNVHARFDNT